MNTPPKLTFEQIEQAFASGDGTHFGAGRAVESIRDQQWLDMLAAAPGVERIIDLHDVAVEFECKYREALSTGFGVRDAGIRSGEADQAFRTAIEQTLTARVPAEARPYEPTEAMRHAAKVIDPALSMETIAALWRSMWSAAAPQPPANVASDRVQLLADALGKCILASGIVRKDKNGFTGPELLLFAKDLEDMLKSSQPAKQPSDDPCPGCMKDTVCRTPSCGRLKLREKNGDKQ